MLDNLTDLEGTRNKRNVILKKGDEITRTELDSKVEGFQTITTKKILIHNIRGETVLIPEKQYKGLHNLILTAQIEAKKTRGKQRTTYTACLSLWVRSSV